MDNKKFQCNRCGTCCKWPGYVRLKDNEIANIAFFLNLKIEEFTERFTILTSDRRSLSLIEKMTTHAYFLTNSWVVKSIQ